MLNCRRRSIFRSKSKTHSSRKTFDDAAHIQTVTGCFLGTSFGIYIRNGVVFGGDHHVTVQFIHVTYLNLYLQVSVVGPLDHVGHWRSPLTE